MSESQHCPFCGLTKESGTSGSITQYIRTCVCSLGKEEGRLEEILDICLRCKKHIGKGRKGSFTQYIFRSELCDCSEPLSLIELEQETEDPSVLSKKAGKSFEEAELELDPTKFPLDRYIPLLELGRGASGIVYLARDRRLQKRVAIKVLTSSDQNQLLAFQEEAKNTSKLNNPYIVRILDFGIAGGSYPYMVLEYLQGISLEDYLKEHGPLAPEAARNLFVQLCLALEYAHDGGIFHRDLKPSNVILVGTTKDKDLEELLPLKQLAVLTLIESPHVTREGIESFRAKMQKPLRIEAKMGDSTNDFGFFMDVPEELNK